MTYPRRLIDLLDAWNCATYIDREVWVEDGLWWFFRQWLLMRRAKLARWALDRMLAGKLRRDYQLQDDGSFLVTDNLTGEVTRRKLVTKTEMGLNEIDYQIPYSAMTPEDLKARNAAAAAKLKAWMKVPCWDLESLKTRDERSINDRQLLDSIPERP